MNNSCLKKGVATACMALFVAIDTQAFYNPSTGRWLSRDPLGDPAFAGESKLQVQDGVSRSHAIAHSEGLAYVMVGNDPCDVFDIVGLIQWVPNQDVGDDKIISRAGGILLDVDVLEGATDAGSKIRFWKSKTTSDYWCHGYTFDGVDASGGPYSPYGASVPKILSDEGWVHTCCGFAEGGIAVFYGSDGKNVTHSGKIIKVDARGNAFNEFGSFLTSKQDSYGSLRNFTFYQEKSEWGSYKCFVKAPMVCGCCPKKGISEISPTILPGPCQ